MSLLAAERDFGKTRRGGGGAGVRKKSLMGMRTERDTFAGGFDTVESVLDGVEGVFGTLKCVLDTVEDALHTFEGV